MKVIEEMAKTGLAVDDMATSVWNDSYFWFCLIANGSMVTYTFGSKTMVQ